MLEWEGWSLWFQIVYCWYGVNLAGLWMVKINQCHLQRCRQGADVKTSRILGLRLRSWFPATATILAVDGASVRLHGRAIYPQPLLIQNTPQLCEAMEEPRYACSLCLGNFSLTTRYVQHSDFILRPDFFTSWVHQVAFSSLQGFCVFLLVFSFIKQCFLK